MSSRLTRPAALLSFVSALLAAVACSSSSSTATPAADAGESCDGGCEASDDGAGQGPDGTTGYEGGTYPSDDVMFFPDVDAKACTRDASDPNPKDTIGLCCVNQGDCQMGPAPWTSCCTTMGVCIACHPM
jgi:hypothetical protein